MRGKQQRTRRKFTADFKRDAVELVQSTGRPVAEVARELGIHDSTLGRWVRQRPIDEAGANGVTLNERSGLRGLEADNARLRMERDLLELAGASPDRRRARSARIPLLNPRESVAVTQTLLRSGLIRFYSPSQVRRIGAGLIRYGLSPGMGPLVGATLYPHAPGMVDDVGRSTFEQLEAECQAVASGLSASGLSPGDAIGVMARNSGDFYEVMVGASRLGLDVTYLNTGFSATQVAEAAASENLQAIVYDDEFVDRIPGSLPSILLIGPRLNRTHSIAMMAAGPSAPIGRPPRRSRHLLLTSGTTGKPKGAARTGGGIESALALLSGLPYRVRATHLIAAPMFHAWGWVNTLLTMLLSSTVVVTQKFDPEKVLALIERWQCDVLVAVPVMLQRIMDLAPEVRNSYDTSTLRVVAVSGSALPKALASSFVREFGYILYSLYGSTEVAFATVATPADLVTAPGTAGHPLPSVSVKVLGSHGQDCPPWVPGSIHVQGNESIVDQSLDPDGHAGGSSRTGDIGWFDEAGRLFVGGREDEMVITGGENVYPITVESALLEHPEVVEAAVIGIPDRQFGEVLEAHVVTSPGSKLKSEDLQAWCRRRLASFQVPRSVVIQTALPRNETGKVIKSQLRSRILSSQSA